MSSEPEDRRFVVVTGTSTGIGAATALHLAAKGFHVFAGVRGEADGDALQAQAPEQLTPLIIEVADEATISAAAAAVAEIVGERGLAGLVNNAGIAKPAPIEFQPMTEFRTKAVLDGKPFATASISRRYYSINLRQQRKLGEKNGGRFVDKTHFVVAGGQVKSMLSWLGYMKHGEPQERVFGLKMPPPNLKPDFEEQARGFVDRIVDEVLHEPVAAST
jgi:NAD(P)-dependent dehydrogenase (short-subunit alcohol dehydrogenase family)